MCISIRNLQRKFPVNKNLIRALTNKLTLLVNIDAESELTLVFVNNKIMQQLNYQYLKHNFPTDVLAFSLSRRKIRRKIRVISDIIINLEIAHKNAKIYKNSLIKEITLYITHGILHLIGFDDHNLKDRIRMQKKQKQLLRELFFNTNFHE